TTKETETEAARAGPSTLFLKQGRRGIAAIAKRRRDVGGDPPAHEAFRIGREAFFMERKVTVPDLQRMKEAGTKITALTAYDFPFAQITDQAGVDVILVGDTLGMVVQGLETTLPVTRDEVIYHCRMVARGRKRASLVVCLPFLSSRVSREEARRGAGRLIKEGACEAVKLEGGIPMADT